MTYKAPPPMSYWDAPTEDQLVSFQDQLMNTPQELSPLDPPDTITSTPPISKQIIQNNAGGERQGIASRTPSSRDMTNNFGYIDKPGIVSAAGMMPGMLGMAGKAVNLGINANNQTAVSGARKTLGLPEQTGFEQAKGIARDTKGVVSDNVSINDHNYPVGFEAQTPEGRTTLTPNEARTRSLTLGGIEETPAPEQDHQSKISSIFDEASSFLDSIFGNTTGANRPTESLSMNQGLSTAERMRSYPDAPAAKGGIAAQTNPNKIAGPWGAAGNAGKGKTGYGHEGTSGQSVGPSGGGKSWGGPH